MRAKAIPAAAPTQPEGLAGGLAIALTIAAVAMWLSSLPALARVSPLIIGTIIGMLIGNLAGLPPWAKPGLVFAMRRLLRLGIVLLGLKLTLMQVVSIGVSGLALILWGVVATGLFTIWLGRRMGVEGSLAELIAAGTAICGASAVVAANEISRGSEEDVAYSVALVTILGSASMLLYPLLGEIAALSSQAYGLWVGASIHEVAQVIAAGYQMDMAAGETATVVKLSRVLLLAPMLIALGAWAGRRRTGEVSSSVPIVPLFVLGFIAMILVASTGLVPEPVTTGAATLSQLLLTTALVALGLETNARRLAMKGIRPLLLGAAATLFLAATTILGCLVFFAS